MANSNNNASTTANGPSNPLDGPADCTIACDEGHITAHKLILCNHSKYLQDILSEFPTAEHPIIILTELSIIDIKILVKYMYTGELVITDDTSPTSLLRAAQILKIYSLTDDEEEDEDEDQDDHDNNISINRRQQHQQQHHHHQQQHQQVQLQHHAHLDRHHLSGQTNEDDDEDMSDRVDDDDEDDEPDEMMDDFQDIEFINRGDPKSLSDSDKNNKIRCHLCNIGLSDVKCLYRHVLTRHLPEKWGYKCEFCDREFSRDDHLMRHYTTKHKNMEFNREKIRETRRLNREMAKNFHDQISSES